MILYVDVLNRLREKGYNTTRLRHEQILPEGTIQRIRCGKPITTDTINTICKMLDCQPGEILAYIPDEEG